MQHSPSRLLAISVAGAVGFVVLRVLYRVVFGGAGSGNTALPSLAPVRLQGPFSHIVLFGPVTLEGIAQAAMSGVPFALAILITGALVAAWDPRGLITLAPRAPFANSLLLAAGIAVSLFPVVIDSISRSRRISALRGLKPGLLSVIPLLETTIERSVQIARALESRGLRSRRSAVKQEAPVVGRPVIQLAEFTVPNRGFGPANWEVVAGSAIVLTGATGSGKTTLLESLAGLVNLRGDTPVAGESWVGVESADIAYLPHDPASIFLTSRVIDDVALGLIARGLPKGPARHTARETLSRWGLGDLADRVPGTLSSGEAATVALVTLLATKPKLLLLDEPLSSLSTMSITRFMEILEGYRRDTASTVIMTDHPKRSSGPAGYDYWQVHSGGIAPGKHRATPVVTPRIPYRAPERDVVLSVSDLRVSHGEKAVLVGVSLEITRGETCVIVGDNGAGKTTALEAIAQATGSCVVVGGRELRALGTRDRVRTVALVPSDPAELFLTSTVADELRLADRIARATSGLTALTLQSILPSDWQGELRGATHPRDLSRGQQAALAIAIQLSHKPSVLLLDEPMRGLDEAARHALVEVVACVVESGTAIVVASHHADQEDLPHDRVLHLKDGILSEGLVEVTQ